MGAGKPRGIAVVDVGATNSKVALFDPDLNVVAERKIASIHRPAPPYAQIDPVPLAAFLAETLLALDQILPIDTVVPAAHGAALALLAEDGTLALPVMDYMAVPPAAVTPLVLPGVPAQAAIDRPLSSYEALVGVEAGPQPARAEERVR